MRTRSIGHALAVATAGVVLLAGCGSKDDTATPPAAGGGSSAPADNGVAALEPSAILAKAQAALKGAKSYHVKGATTEDGEKTTIDLKLSGADLAGTLGTGAASVQLLKVNGVQYIKPDKAFWKMTGGAKADGMIEVVGDRWVKVPATDKSLGSLFAVTDPVKILQPEGTVTKGGTKTIGGTPAIGLVDKGTDTSTLYIATVGEAYPLAVEGATPGEGLTFSEFGQPVAGIAAPAEADVLDISKVTG